MVPAIPRHNVNLTLSELAATLGAAAGWMPPSGSRRRFETAFADYLGVRYAAAVGSGRSALALALRAIDLPRGAVVALPRYCFFTIVGVVEALGLAPRFIDVDPERLCLDPQALRRDVDGASAVVLVHPFGQTADAVAVEAICRDAGATLIEDPSQSTGAAVGRRRVGSLGDVATFSLVSGKNLQTFGGGIVATDRADTAARVGVLVDAATAPASRSRRPLRAGLAQWLLSTRVGFNTTVYPALRAIEAVAPARLAALFHEPRVLFDAHAPPRRLSDAQAYLGLEELAELDGRNTRRRHNAMRLIDALSGVAGLKLQAFDADDTNTFNAVVARVGDGAGLARRLLRHGVDTRTDYMEWFGGPPPFDDDVLYLPNHPGLSDKAVDHVARSVRRELA